MFLVPLYGEGSYRQCLLPYPYYVLVHNKNISKGIYMGIQYPPPPDYSAKTRLCVTYSRCSTIEVAKSKIIQPFIAFVEVTICKNVKIQMGR